MKIIKYYSWEVPYTELLSKIRNSEMNVLLKIQFLRNAVSAIAVSLASFSAMIGFLSVYGYYGYLKNAANIFSSVTLFNILTGHVSMLPTALSTGADAMIAFRRVQKFLLASEEIPDPEYHIHKISDSVPAVSIQNGEFIWAEQQQQLQLENNETLEGEKNEKSENQTSNFTGLHNINLNITHKEFIVITGSIGSGKSSLLAAMSSLMSRVSGRIDVSGNLLLCSNPWIQNATVKNNITFGLPYNKVLYRTVVDVCALQSDFDILPAGDQTEIGERGVNLSGGQKARINLARAVYKVCHSPENNIILLDDVLSAVDAKVGKHIMERCFMGLLAEKTRVLATHQLALIGSADRIIFLNGDGTIDIGTHEELMARNALFSNLMGFQQESKSKEKEAVTEDDGEEDEDEGARLIRKQTTKVEYNENKGKLIQREHREVNGIKKDVLLEFIKSGCGKTGLGIMVPAVFASITMTTFCMLFQNVWLSFWSTDRFHGKSDGFYIGFYVMFTVLFVLCAIWEFCTLVFMCNNASRSLNIRALEKIMHAPMSFFDTTPMVEIVLFRYR
ncbi:unnamed protein product [Ambrosiozyma monospora]|uniref:Unnamed protein product n=1 Tax=Ambrosiozyma monospora TaxID=43982 RepID=A0ACB5T7U5_AMBMO|nr:unnamed protein product [Ambrosiozyma monospora]